MTMEFLNNPFLIMGANLLANNQPSPVKRGLGNIVGQSMLQAQPQLLQADQRMRQAKASQAAQAALLDPAGVNQRQLASSLFDMGQPDLALQTMGVGQTPQGPMSSIAKLQADLTAGRITPEQYEVAVSKMGNNINVLPSPPAGYQYKDPMNPGQGMQFITGGPADPQVKATQKAAESQKKVEGALGILDELEELALGEKGIFKEFQPTGMLGRAGHAVEAFMESKLQTDPRYATYEGVSMGTVAPIIKALGDSGNLAEGDVGRALASIPNLRGIPDTEEVARQKVETLRRILGKVSPAALESAIAKAKPTKPRRYNPQTGRIE